MEEVDYDNFEFDKYVSVDEDSAEQNSRDNRKKKKKKKNGGKRTTNENTYEE